MANKNPDMSGLTSWKPGQSGNPGGKSAAQRKREIRNATIATRLRGKMLAALEKKLKEAEEAADAEAISMINNDILRLLKDTEDRGLGAPEQLISHQSPDGSMSPRRVELVAKPVKADGK